MQNVSALLHSSTTDTQRADIEPTLLAYPEHLRALAITHGVVVRQLQPRQTYKDASPALRRLRIDVDAWPVPPAGLFIVEERTVLLRAATPMTIAHEFGHALDCALGGGVYLSGYDPAIRDAWNKARAYVTPYAASGLDEYFAESCRAFVGVNDAKSLWPVATRERLFSVDARLHAILDGIFAEEAA
ncbi:MAG: hypothetical protein NVS3B16_24840 [Vulcanimicrobiaceae bacterium]